MPRSTQKGGSATLLSDRSITEPGGTAHGAPGILAAAKPKSSDGSLSWPQKGQLIEATLGRSQAVVSALGSCTTSWRSTVSPGNSSVGPIEHCAASNPTVLHDHGGDGQKVMLAPGLASGR